MISGRRKVKHLSLEIGAIAWIAFKSSHSGWNVGTIYFNGVNNYIVENCIVPHDFMLLRLLLDFFHRKSPCWIRPNRALRSGI